MIGELTGAGRPVEGLAGIGSRRMLDCMMSGTKFYSFLHRPQL